MPKVKIGGYIWVDDALWTDSTGYVTTKKAYDFIADHCEFIKSVDDGNCLLYRKIKEVEIIETKE